MGSLQTAIVSFSLFCVIAVLFLMGLRLQRSRHKRVRNELSKSEQRYFLALESSTDGIWDWDIASDTLIYSDRFLETMGAAFDKNPGTMASFQSRIHPEDLDASREAIERHLKQHVPYNLEYRLCTDSGEYRWLLTRGKAVLDDAGNVIRMSGWIQDISERKQAELNLQGAISEIGQLKDQLEAERAYLQDEIKHQYNHENIIGKSEGLNYVLYKVEQIAATDTTVLLLGETGTGKELIARAIHNLSLRKDRALVKINCANLTPNLIESELFGHEKGAFTGAHARQPGRFEIANGATLFLDEIGELPLELQPKLLRVIQDGQFERLGSSQTIKVDVRVIAATNRHMEEEVRKGRFREDLWYRLNIFPITVPPLRERSEDIPLLVEYFVKIISKRLGKTIDSIPSVVMASLKNYSWPGNIRELENVLERAVINSASSKLRLMDELDKTERDSTMANRSLAEVEREYILRVLEQTGWKVSGKDSASEILGLDRSTLRARMRKLGIQK